MTSTSQVKNYLEDWLWRTCCGWCYNTYWNTQTIGSFQMIFLAILQDYFQSPSVAITWNWSFDSWRKHSSKLILCFISCSFFHDLVEHKFHFYGLTLVKFGVLFCLPFGPWLQCSQSYPKGVITRETSSSLLLYSQFTFFLFLLINREMFLFSLKYDNIINWCYNIFAISILGSKSNMG